MLTLQRRQVVAAAALCLVAWGSQVQSVGAEGVPAERRLPQGTTVFLSVPDVTAAKEQFMRSSFGQMMQDDAFKSIREECDQWWAEKSKEAQDELGIPPAELLNLLDGELAFAVVQPPGKDIGGVLMIEFGEHRETLDALLEKARGELEDQAERSVETVQDTEVVTYLFDESDQGNGRGSTAYFIKDEYLVLAMADGTASVGILEEVLLRWDGEHPQTLADQDVYSTVMLKCQSGSEEPHVRWYFNPIELLRSALNSMPQAGQMPIQPAMISGMLPVLGLNNFKGVGGTVTIMTDEFDSVSRTFMVVDQPTSGLLKIFEFPATSQQPPQWVPATTASYASMNWDVTGAYKAIEALVDFFQPPGTLATMVDQLSQVGPQIHIKDDVIDALTGRIQTLGELRSDVDLQAAATQPVVIAFEVSNEEKMAGVLERVSASLDEKLETREFRDVKIYESEIPNFQGGRPQSMGMCVARGQLFFATDVELLEGYLRESADETLANSADYRRVASHFPGKTSYMSFQRPAAQLKPVYEMIRDGQLEAMIPEIDFSKLPEFDKIAHYFNLTGSYAVPADGGAMYVQFGLHRD